MRKPCILYVGASGYGIGYFLGRGNNNELKLALVVELCRYWKTVFSVRQRVNDSVLWREKCYVYLYQNGFIVYTDHEPLTHNEMLKDIINRRYRWLQFLEECNTKLICVKSESNIVALNQTLIFWEEMLNKSNHHQSWIYQHYSFPVNICWSWRRFQHVYRECFTGNICF